MRALERTHDTRGDLAKITCGALRPRRGARDEDITQIGTIHARRSSQ